MYRVIVTVHTDSRATAEQVAEIIRNLFALVKLGITVEVEENEP